MDNAFLVRIPGSTPTSCSLDYQGNTSQKRIFAYIFARRGNTFLSRMPGNTLFFRRLINILR